MDIELSQSQHLAVAMAEKWYNDGTVGAGRPIFRLSGYAGTGKTTTIKHLVERLKLSTEFAAYTGKAALVMCKHGTPAVTIHSLIYKYQPPDANLCKELFEAIKTAKVGQEKRELKAKLKQAQQPSFVLNDSSRLWDAELLVLDECSMVNGGMLADLLQFETPIIALGDPGQLPPIEGTGALFREPEDVKLTEIHRQAKDSPIIGMSVRAREGVPILPCQEGQAQHITRADLDSHTLLKHGQILTGKNATRRKINRHMRRLHELSGTYPQVNEHLICLRNNVALGLYNGLMAEVTAVGEMFDTSLELEIVTEIQNEPFKVRVLRAYFDEYEEPGALENVRWWERTDVEEFDFGYAITVHKAQGSQWDSVMLVDDKFLVWKLVERRRWLYTAITRAAESFTLVS